MKRLRVRISSPKDKRGSFEGAIRIPLHASLFLLGARVLHHVASFGEGGVVPQCLNVNHSDYMTVAAAVLEHANLLSPVIENVRAPAKGVDGSRVFGQKEIGANVRSNDVQVI